MIIGGLDTSINTSDINNDIQVAMLRKSLDTIETSGAELTKMMEASVTPELGQNIDKHLIFICIAIIMPEAPVYGQNIIHIQGLLII